MQDVVTIVNCHRKCSHSTTRYVRLCGESVRYCYNVAVVHSPANSTKHYLQKARLNSLRTPLNHGAEQASNETLKQTQQRN